ncbi:MAG: hypothetical protein WA906_02045 [Pacificimonas sp.]
MTDIFDQIETFFHSFVEALNANDEEVILSFLAIPHGLRLAEETTFIEAPEELRDYMDARLMSHEAVGAENLHATVEEVSELPGDAAAARVHWELIDADGDEVTSYDTRETLAAKDEVWAIVASDLTDERAALAALPQLPGTLQ